MNEALAKEGISEKHLEANKDADDKEWAISPLLHEMNALTAVWKSLEDEGFEARHTVNTIESLCREIIAIAES